MKNTGSQTSICKRKIRFKSEIVNLLRRMLDTPGGMVVLTCSGKLRGELSWNSASAMFHLTLFYPSKQGGYLPLKQKVFTLQEIVEYMWKLKNTCVYSLVVDKSKSRTPS